jgi:hypothetical protein
MDALDLTIKNSLRVDRDPAARLDPIDKAQRLIVLTIVDAMLPSFSNCSAQ